MVKRGEIYWTDFGKVGGSVQAGRRPALIVQWDATNAASTTTIIVSISSQPRRRAYPFHVPLAASKSGLPLDSTIQCEQIRTVEQLTLDGPVSALNAELMREVDIALHRSLGLQD